ncbi:MAG: hypothetical protein WCG78_00160 [Candidatus Omnitrophota bacterium]
MMKRCVLTPALCIFLWQAVIPATAGDFNALRPLATGEKEGASAAASVDEMRALATAAVTINAVIDFIEGSPHWSVSSMGTRYFHDFQARNKALDECYQRGIATEGAYMEFYRYLAILSRSIRVTYGLIDRYSGALREIEGSNAKVRVKIAGYQRWSKSGAFDVGEARMIIANSAKYFEERAYAFQILFDDAVEQLAWLEDAEVLSARVRAHRRVLATLSTEVGDLREGIPSAVGFCQRLEHIKRAQDDLKRSCDDAFSFVAQSIFAAIADNCRRVRDFAMVLAGQSLVYRADPGTIPAIGAGSWFVEAQV